MISIPDVAARYWLDTFLESVSPVYHLYVNGLDPTRTTTLADFVEADWPDYEPQTATPWNPATMVCGRAVATADPLVWFKGLTGLPALVYGYYVTDGVDGELLWAERRIAGPIPMDGPTKAVQVTPRITFRGDPDGEEPCGAFRQGRGDLVGDGSSTHGPPPVAGGGDLVGDGSSTHEPPPVAGGGDLVGDGSSTHSIPAIPAGGDLVGDGSSVSGPASRAGGGDLVGDGSSVSGPVVVFSIGDLVGDGESTV